MSYVFTMSNQNALNAELALDPMPFSAFMASNPDASRGVAGDFVSSKYVPIDGFDVIRGIEEQSGKQAFVSAYMQDPSGGNLISFSLDKGARGNQHGADYRQEIMALNSNNGQVPFTLGTGAYRFQCANSLIIGTNTEQVKIKHIGQTVAAQVAEAHGTIMDRFARSNFEVQAMRSHSLNSADFTVMAADFLADKERQATRGLLNRWSGTPEGLAVKLEDITQGKAISERFLVRDAMALATDEARETNQKLSIWHGMNAIQALIMRGKVRTFTNTSRFFGKVKGAYAATHINQTLFNRASGLVPSL